MKYFFKDKFLKVSYFILFFFLIISKEKFMYVINTVLAKSRKSYLDDSLSFFSDAQHI